MRVAVVGASGYAGLELVRIVLRHPELELVAATSEKRAGTPVAEVFPGLRGLLDLDFEAADAGALAGRIDVAFTALPHGTSAGLVAELHKAGGAGTADDELPPNSRSPASSWTDASCSPA